MILVELSGGLGNQLFQYAAAKALAIQKQTQLKLDVQFFEERSKNSDVGFFHIADSVATNQEIEKLGSRCLVRKAVDRLLPAHKRKIYREPFFHFDQHFFETNLPIYLKGLRQSERYFSSHKQAIREVLKIKPQFIQAVLATGDKIKSENSVSIHIRRGDYLTDIALEVLGLTPLEYYKVAIERLSTQIDSPTFYFFSDDIEWVKANINLSFKYEFASGNLSHTAIEDLYLMSQCKHNIIANSSFSWWGAWLNDNPNKIVIAPKQWFNKGPKDTQDLIPEDWLRL